MSYRRFGASPAGIAGARRWTSRLVSDQPDHIRENVALVVSELCTNALVHTGAGFEVGIERGDADLMVEVTDASNGQPALREPTQVEPHGRGLHIVDELASDWGVLPVEGPNKIVWARLALVQ